MIWASSFIVLKKALDQVGPLTLAGLRYFGGFVLLLPFLAGRGELFRPRSFRNWQLLLLTGLLSFTIGNGALFWALQYLPATTGSFLGNLIPVPVLILGIVFLQEWPTHWQVLGVMVALGGNGLFFTPGLEPGQPLALAVTILAVLAFGGASIITRGLARERQAGPLALTAFPLAAGGGTLLLVALFVEGRPHLSPQAWGYLLLLTVVHTVLGYLLYNHAYEHLRALEMNMLLNLMPLGTALWAWFFLGERLVWPQQVGMVLTIAGMTMVQLLRRPAGQDRA